MTEREKKSDDKDGKLADDKEAFRLASEHEQENRTAALDDLKFSRLNEQWDDAAKKAREKEGRPCLTNNKLPAFIRQVTNDARQNKPALKVHPADSAADPATAEVYNGLIRNIEATSRAGIAYDTAFDFAVSMGFGYFRVSTRYACDDTFDIDLCIDRIANPFSVYGDPNSTDADSSNWDSGFVTELMPRDEFQRRFKDAEEVDWDAGPYSGLSSPWQEDKQILVAERWIRDKIKKNILLLSDQTVMAEDEFAKRRGDLEPLGISVVGSRKVDSHRVRQRLMSGAEILEERDWAGKYIPIVPVYGEEVNVEGKRHFRSLIRDAKDPQRMHNYWRTMSTELVALAPKAPFIGPVGSFTTDQAKWETANTQSHSYIEYDPKAGAPPPQRQAFAGIPAGALQEALNAADDIKSIIGIYDASLGARSNETSGKAILARQREGDVSTFHFIDNLARAIEHCGRILIDLIPKVYTGERIVRVLGPQQEVSTVPLGKPTEVKGPDGQVTTKVFDLGVGKYDLTVTTGPSFTTRREEAATQMMELIQAYPDAAPIIGDLLAKNLDWPGADEIATRLKAMLPAQVQGEQGGNAEAQAQVEQITQQAQQIMGELQKTQQELQQIKSDRRLDEMKLQNEQQKIQIDAYKAETDRMSAQAQARTDALTRNVPASMGQA